MAYLPIFLIGFILGYVQSLSSVQLNQYARESSIQNVSWTELARDTVQLCYSPNGHPEVCKYYVFAEPYRGSWQGARDYCTDLGDLLGVPLDTVAIESKEENELLGEHIFSDTNLQNLVWWTSGHDTKAPFMFIWGATGYSFTYNSWNENQPSDTDNSQNGVPVFYNNGVLEWYDEDMAFLAYALCEQNN